MNIADEAARQLVIFRLGSQQFCVPIGAVKEIRPWTLATPLPHSPPFVLGVINLRGTVLPVVDLGMRLHMLVEPPTDRNVIVIVWIGKQLFGLLVDGVCDILTVGEEAFQATPNVGGANTDALIGALVNVDERLINFIALECLLTPGQAVAA
jgi:purine-binding chemotaxis protein CheW